MADRKENIRSLMSLGVSGVLVAFVLGLAYVVMNPNNSSQVINPLSDNNNSNSTRDRISLGDKILVTADTNPDKQAGVEAFARRDYTTAVNKFQSSLKTNRNDPETLIYLNNANAKPPTIKVAVSVPIGSALDLAKETLRGLAEAQNEVNHSGGINGVPLQIQIANTDGDPEKIKQLDLDFINDPRILAVVGSSRNASLYNQGGLVKVSTINAIKPSEIAKYVFYATPSPSVFADTIARYIVQNARIKNVVVCNDSTSISGSTTVEEYANYIRQAGGKVSSIVCDLGARDFNPSTFMSRAISNGAEGLLLIPRADKINLAVDLVKENRGRLSLFGLSQLYTKKTLQLGQADVNRMVLSVPWHPDAIADNSFASNANQLWGGQVNARTAIAYDALQIIIAGLKQNSTRDGLQKALSNPNFAVSGATGKIQFLPSGDRKGGVFLVKIEPGQVSGTGYDFKLVR